MEDAVRCSSCEPLLDAYLEATLRPVQARQVAEHVGGCTACDALLRELRVIDALLATASSPARFDAGFTAAVLSAAQSAAPPARPGRPYWFSLALYLAVAWVVGLVAALRWRELGLPVRDLWQSQAHGVAAFAAVVRALAPATPLAAAAVTGVLIIDSLLVCAMFFAYRHLRPRLALYLDRGPRS